MTIFPSSQTRMRSTPTGVFHAHGMPHRHDLNLPIPKKFINGAVTERKHHLSLCTLARVVSESPHRSSSLNNTKSTPGKMDDSYYPLSGNDNVRFLFCCFTRHLPIEERMLEGTNQCHVSTTPLGREAIGTRSHWVSRNATTLFSIRMSAS